MIFHGISTYHLSLSLSLFYRNSSFFSSTGLDSDRFSVSSLITLVFRDGAIFVFTDRVGKIVRMA